MIVKCHDWDFSITGLSLDFTCHLLHMPRTGVDALARFAAWARADREAHRIADGGFGRKWVSRF